MLSLLFSRLNRTPIRRSKRRNRRRNRLPRFEQLDVRYAMASDLQMSLPSSLPEGEPAPDLVAFAKQVTAGGIRLFVADWAQESANQLQVFGDAVRYLNTIEVTTPERTLNSTGASENITSVPTWKSTDGSAIPRLLSISDLSGLSGLAIPSSSTPSFFPIDPQSVNHESPLHIPIDAYDPNNDPLTISVSSSNPANVTAEVVAGNPMLELRWKATVKWFFNFFSRKLQEPSIDLSLYAERFLQHDRDDSDEVSSRGKRLCHSRW